MQHRILFARSGSGIWESTRRKGKKRRYQKEILAVPVPSMSAVQQKQKEESAIVTTALIANRHLGLRRTVVTKITTGSSVKRDGMSGNERDDDGG